MPSLERRKKPSRPHLKVHRACLSLAEPLTHTNHETAIAPVATAIHIAVKRSIADLSNDLKEEQRFALFCNQMAVSLTVGGWLAQAFIQTLIDKASDKAIQLFAERRGFAEDMKKLHTSLLQTQITLDEVQSSRSNNIKWKTLMQELKDASYDAEDLIDEFQYNILRQKIKGEEEDKASGSSGLLSILPAAKKLFGSSYDERARVREIQGRLETSMKSIVNLPATHDRGKQPEVKFQARESCSSPVADKLIGREKELNQVVEWLLGSANQVEPASGFVNDTFSILPIVGIGGAGKTTLGLTKSIIESVTLQKQGENMGLEPLQKILHQHIVKKKFLLVLDDVWSDDKSIWEKFCALLKVGAHGSKIIVTTRGMKVSKMVSLAEPILLHGLDEDAFWQLFNECSFGTLNPEDYPGLEDIGRKIVRKLNGSPLAAKTIGRVLRSNICQQHWATVMESDIWKAKQDEDDIMPALQLSYQYLDENLKHCFAFCSLFPIDHKFDKTELVRMWMAEGFINEDKNTKSMEDVGSDYFLEFVNSSFFQESRYHYEFWDGFGIRIVMHDLIHDLAEMISTEETCRIENSRHTKPASTTRHLRVEKEKLPLEFSGYNKLRTLVLKLSLPDSSLFEILRSIRVLVVSWCGLLELSERIGKLIHLRYLDISYSKIKILPDLLCDLYNLQTLKAEYCYELESIPQELGKLVNLRHFDISNNFKIKILPDSLCDLYNLQTLKVNGCSELESIPQELGKLVNLRHIDADKKIWLMIKDVWRLTNLQELPTFSVREDDELKLGQLKDLTQLHGTLCIQNLENVVDGKEAQRAKLKSKVHLKELVLEWNLRLDGAKDAKLDEEVIEVLQPHESLKILTIRWYNGGRSPSWLMPKVLPNLEKLELENCMEWDDVLPFIGQRLHLIELRMTGMPALKRLSHEFEGKCFPKLQVLKLCKFKALREWSCTEGKDLFPCLRELCLRRIECLGLLKSLKELKIVECPKLVQLDVGDEQAGSLSSLRKLCVDNTALLKMFLLRNSLPFITELEIESCSEEVIFVEPIWVPSLTAVTSLTLHNCKKLQYLPTELLHGLTPRLQCLQIYGCPHIQLQAIPENLLPIIPFMSLLSLNRLK
ncbi:hypothetical protein ZIOFF_000225 [Zingiber officinale]|uniref:Uncharacterized protein n=1 Tax=Zingiber officinale TaxID=94328 RepID=A0A8J5M6H2_ZINOF|nr:hypothetical protein ZIOFF_000225 [Zingiber officinale]